MSKKVAKFTEGKDRVGYYFYCEGCECSHSIYVKGEGVLNWGFNNNEENPTFTPSILVTYEANPKASKEFPEWKQKRVCHSYITNGKIKYLNDSYHSLKGKTVELLNHDEI